MHRGVLPGGPWAHGMTPRPKPMGPDITIRHETALEMKEI